MKIEKLFEFSVENTSKITYSHLSLFLAVVQCNVIITNSVSSSSQNMLEWLSRSFRSLGSSQIYSLLLP